MTGSAQPIDSLAPPPTVWWAVTQLTRAPGHCLPGLTIQPWSLQQLEVFLLQAVELASENIQVFVIREGIQRCLAHCWESCAYICVMLSGFCLYIDHLRQRSS